MIKRKKSTNSNLRLAGIFLIVVLGLIIISIVFKFLLVVKTSKFDGTHSFIVSFSARNNSRIVAFSPQDNSLSVLNIEDKSVKGNFARTLEIPIDGSIVSVNSGQEDVPTTVFHSIFSMQKYVNGLTILDAIRLFIFSKTVPKNNISVRDFSENLGDAQKSTVLSLSFTDPAVYQENKSIEIINATDTFGLGTRLATLVTNIGGNVVLVSTADNVMQNSKITYFKDKSYTVKKLSEYLGIPAVESDNRGLADIIITIGTDKENSSKF